MRTDKRGLGIGGLLFLSLLVWGQPGSVAQRYTFEHPQMGTVFRLVFYAKIDSNAAKSLASGLFEQIDTLNAIFSDWTPDSELSRLCTTAGSGSRVPVSPELFDILSKAVAFSEKSDGAFDITVGPLTRLWRRSRSFKELPAAEKVDEARQKVGWQNIRLYPSPRQVELLKAGTGLDLGGIAQGWTADYCLKRLAEKGIFSALVDAGGDIALGDPPPGQAGWHIALPEKNGRKRQLLLSNCGITTSGATYRYLEVNGKRYSHIVDPKTGQALTHRNLVTVMAPDATTADAWATAISVSGKKGKKRASKVAPQLKIWFNRMPL